MLKNLASNTSRVYKSISTANYFWQLFSNFWWTSSWKSPEISGIPPKIVESELEAPLPKDSIDQAYSLYSSPADPNIVHFCGAATEFDEQKSDLVDQLGLGKKHAPVIDLREQACRDMSVREAIIQRKRTARNHLKRDANFVTFVTDETSISCLRGKIEEPLKRTLKELSSEGSIFFVYTNGCDASEYSDNIDHLFVKRSFEPAAGIERASMVRDLRKNIAGAQNCLSSAEVARLVLQGLSSETLTLVRLAMEAHGSLSYDEWKATDEYKALPEPPRAKRAEKGGKPIVRATVTDRKPTKYFEKFWPDFDGELPDLRVDQDLYDAVYGIVKHYPPYLEELRSHLRKYKVLARSA